MLKDPWMKWESGVFPYDALSCVQIDADTSMDALNDVPYLLIERGLWTNQARLAWEQLRTPEKRVWVDWLSYPETVADIVACFEAAWENHASRLEITDVLSAEVAELDILLQQLTSGEYVSR